MAATVLTDAEFERFRNYIEKECGIVVGQQKAYLVESRLTGLLAETGCSTFGQLHAKAVSEPQSNLRDRIVDAMTTNETLWFRDTYPYAILENELFPRFAAEATSGRRSRLRVWSAGCSTGQEPYSIAMTALEYNRKNPSRQLPAVEITATDISPSVLYLATAGRYDQIAISRGLPADMKERYFNNTGKVWSLSDSVKKLVTFKRFNLQDRPASLGGFDIIFCRNVMIYFSEQFKRSLLSSMAALLRPSGYLFLGSAESLAALSSEFVMLTYQNRNLYYQVMAEAL